MEKSAWGMIFSIHDGSPMTDRILHGESAPFYIQVLHGERL